MPDNYNKLQQNVEGLTVSLPRVFSVLLALCILMLGWWANANDANIKEATDLAAKNAESIQTLILLVDRNAQQVQQSQEIIKKAAENAQANKETLIKIEERLIGIKKQVEDIDK